MDLDAWQKLTSIVSLLIAIGTAAYAWLTRSAKAAEREIVEVDGRLDDIEGRLRDVENELKHLPRKDDIVELKLAVGELRAAVGQTADNMKAIKASVDRLTDFLMEPRR